MRYLPLKSLLLCTVLTSTASAAATLHESHRGEGLGARSAYSHQDVRVPREDWENLQTAYRCVMLHATLASPTIPLDERRVAALPATTVRVDEGERAVVALESRMDSINLHNKDITFSNASDFLGEIQRFVETYQVASRTDSFVVDLSANSIDGGFLERLLVVLEPVKDRVSELRLHQNGLYLRSIEQLAPLLMLESFKYLTVYANFIGTKRLLAFGEGVYDEDADDGYDAVYLTQDDLLKLPMDQRRTCLQKMIWIPKAYFKPDADPTNVPTVEGLISSDEILRIHRTYYGLPVRD